MQEITLKVQMGLGMLAHILESVGNAFNFSVPFLSWLLFTVLGIATVVLYYVPLRWVTWVGRSIIRSDLSQSQNN